MYDKMFKDEFQSTPLMRGETSQREDVNVVKVISIHSPHARGDDVGERVSDNIMHFNPLPSCEGRQGCSMLCII